MIASISRWSAQGVPIATFDDRLRRAAGLADVAVYAMKGRR
jgi:hypothetical protein